MSKHQRFAVLLGVVLVASAARQTEAGLIVDDAVFAHDFEQISGASITALRGPNATINSSNIVPSTASPKNGSTQHISPTYPGNQPGEYVNTNKRLTNAANELSFSIFYNAQGDNGSEGSSLDTATLRYPLVRDGLFGPGGPHIAIRDDEVSGRRSVWKRISSEVLRSHERRRIEHCAIYGPGSAAGSGVAPSWIRVSRWANGWDHHFLFRWRAVRRPGHACRSRGDPRAGRTLDIDRRL